MLRQYLLCAPVITMSKRTSESEAVVAFNPNFKKEIEVSYFVATTGSTPDLVKLIVSRLA